MFLLFLSFSQNCMYNWNDILHYFYHANPAFGPNNVCHLTYIDFSINVVCEKQRDAVEHTSFRQYVPMMNLSKNIYNFFLIKFKYTRKCKLNIITYHYNIPHLKVMKFHLGKIYTAFLWIKLKVHLYITKRFLVTSLLKTGPVVL